MKLSHDSYWHSLIELNKDLAGPVCPRKVGACEGMRLGKS